MTKKRLISLLFVCLFLVNFFAIVHPVSLKADGGFPKLNGAFSLSDPSGCWCPDHGKQCFCPNPGN